MHELTPGRTRLALLALTVGGFGIGVTEFVAMGILPDVAQALLPQLYVTNQEEAIAQAGYIITAYAAGVVVGAPTLAIFSARFPRRRMLMIFASAFFVGSVLSALAPNLETLVVARFLAALPHGAYFGIATLVAADLVGPARRGQALAIVLGGLTIANTVGVPLATFLAQTFGWRSAYVVVSVVFIITVFAVRLAVPAQPGDPRATAKRELRGFRRGRVWLALLAGALGFGGFFAVYSYVAPLATEVTGLDSSLVPIVLVVAGLGMVVGNWWGGRLAMRGAMRALFIVIPLFAASFVLLILISPNPVGLFVGVFVVSVVGSAAGPPMQARLLDVAGHSQTLGAAAHHAAFNIGNGLGAALGGMTIAAGFGYTSPAYVGIGLAAIGLVFVLASRYVDHRPNARPITGMIPVIPHH